MRLRAPDVDELSQHAAAVYGKRDSGDKAVLHQKQNSIGDLLSTPNAPNQQSF